MTSEEAVYKLAEHLLGESWYLIDPLGSEQANDAIVNAIKKYYPAAENTPVEKWRIRHKRCTWCVYYLPIYNKFNPVKGVIETQYKCVAKDKVISNILMPRPFCTLFNLKKEE